MIFCTCACLLVRFNIVRTEDHALYSCADIIKTPLVWSSINKIILRQFGKIKNKMMPDHSMLAYIRMFCNIMYTEA